MTNDLFKCGPITWRDALTLLAGKKLGSGVSRDVFECAFDPTLVVKSEDNARSRFQNQREWAVWQAVEQSKVISRWFAPCVAISYAGIWMLQKRTEPVTLKELRKALPRVPLVFTDLKAQNWGRLDGRIVCHDYGTALTTEHGLSHRTKKAEWWELDR